MVSEMPFHRGDGSRAVKNDNEKHSGTDVKMIIEEFV